MRYATTVLALLLAAPAFAQVQNRPTDAPFVTAENELWYRLREPMIFAGESYYPVGPVVFFNGDVMVRTGHYNGVPLYADTTIEPYSVVYVPIGRGLMQPYERVRSGELAGTSGSRPPSFPGRSERTSRGMAYAAGSPTNLPQPIGAISVYTPDREVIPTTAPGESTSGAVGTSLLTGTVMPLRRPGRPVTGDSVWLEYRGGRWVNDGPSIPIDNATLVRVGEYAGFPVYARKGVEDGRIFVPMSRERVAPFRLKE